MTKQVNDPAIDTDASDGGSTVAAGGTSTSPPAISSRQRSRLALSSTEGDPQTPISTRAHPSLPPSSPPSGVALSVDGVHEKVVELSERVEHQGDHIDRLVSFKTYVKGISVGIGLFAGTLGLLAGFIASRYWTELNEKVERAKTGGETAALVTQVGAELTVSRLEHDAFVIMEELSRNSRDDELLAVVRRNAAAAEELAKLQSSTASSPAIKTAIVLSRMYPLIGDYAIAVKKAPGNERLSELRSASKRWMDLSLDGCGQAFVKKFEAYRKNVLGLVAMELAKASGAPEHRRDFDKARGYFEEALESDPQFAKAHLNLGLIALYAWDSKAAKDVSLLDDARKSYSLARKFAASPVMRSMAYNNLADAYLKESDWHLAQRAIRAAEGALRQAERNLAYTFAQADVKAAAYVTRAEALCLDAAVRDKWAKAASQARGGRAEEVRNLLRVASDLGYMGFLDKKPKQIEATHPLLARCSTLDKEFIASIAGLASGAEQ